MRAMVAISVACVLVAGCASHRAAPPVEVRPPQAVPDRQEVGAGQLVPQAGGAESATSPAGAVVPRVLPSQPPRQLADGSKVPAVQGLLSTAERERRAGRLESAAAALERAQRLAPQSALVYQRLAEVRLQQKRPAEAEHLARKGVGFASGAGMQAALWRLIAEARRQQGRLPAADEAAARAAALEEHATDAL